MPAAVLLFRGMSDSFSNPTPQFGTAEYATKPGSNLCQFCQQPLSGTYYRVNAALACPGCAEKMRSESDQDTHAAYVRALTYGIGAGVVGLIGYALIAILLQGWVISYMSIGVGWIVGTAMMKGSNGVGGRRYQIAAALVTYAAVSMAAVPIWIHFADEKKQQRQAQQQKPADEQHQLEQESGQRASEPRSAPGSEKPRAERPPVSLGTWLGRVALIGLASPFIQLSGNPFWGAMGLLILFFGMRIAWRIAEGKPFGIYGPFAYAPPT
jgi:hypothetical protein